MRDAGAATLRSARSRRWLGGGDGAVDFYDTLQCSYTVLLYRGFRGDCHFPGTGCVITE